MNYKNGYKVVYEVAADGKRTFYAATSNEYPTRDADGKIIDTELATFNDADFAGKTIYEYAGEFYVSTGAVPAYNEDGTPKDEKIKGFEKLFVDEAAVVPAAVAETEPEVKVEDEGEDPEVEKDEEPETDPEEDETEIDG
jgi:hypothetical protein